MTASLALGRVDDASTTRWLRRVRGYIESMERHGTEHLRSFHKELIEAKYSYSYNLLNGLGYLYGARLARAYVEPLFPVAEREGADGLAEAAAPVVDTLRDIVFDALLMMQRRDPTMLREAFAELAQVLPVADLDIESEIEQALTSYQGRSVYFRDFQLDIWSVLGTTAELLESFLIFHAVPEEVLVHPVENRQYFMPTEMFRAGPPGPSRVALLRDVLKAANDKVRRQTYYGVRQERVPNHPFFTVLMWSNGAASWFINWAATEALPRHCIRRGRCEWQFDANEIVVPYPPLAVYEIIAAIDLHPLYEFSLEAKERGEYPEATAAGVRRAIRSAIDTAMPGMDPEERAVLAIDWFKHFVAAKGKAPGEKEKIEAFIREFPVWPGFVRMIEEWIKEPRREPW